MTTPRPVRYRCELSCQVETPSAAVQARLLEISETGAFVEEVRGLEDLQIGDLGVLGLHLPGGEPWWAPVRITRWGTGRLDVRSSVAEHVSVTIAGYGLEFQPIMDEDMERLRDFLELLDTR